MLKLCSISLFHPLYGPKMDFWDIKRCVGVKPRFPARPKGIMPFRWALKVTKGDESGRFFDFSPEGDHPSAIPTFAQGGPRVHPFAGR